MSVRNLLKNSFNGRLAAKELLQSIFTADMIYPSRCLWIVSPWIRNIPVLQNHVGEFTALAPDMMQKEIYLGQLIRESLYRNTAVVIATRPLPENRSIKENIGDTSRFEVNGRFKFIEMDNLHIKGIVGDRFALSGSMNLTFSGMEINDELLTYQVDPSEVETLRLAFHEEYGGVL